MISLHRTHPIPAAILLCALVILVPATASAYDQYSQGDTETNCAACHGDFRGNNYISPADGQNWGDIHDLHRNDMLNGDCSTCHGSGGRFPVPLDSSAGGDGLDPIACMGCHGRAEDNVAANPEFPNGMGAGLRQHHTNAGVSECLECHDDALPANYTPVGESVLPPYYANPGTDHPAIPTDPCNAEGSEDFAGLTVGLDNDGNHEYDGADADCNVTGVPSPLNPTARLLQNHPNPFNPSTNIQYVMNGPGHVLLQVFSVNGDLVRTLVNAYHDKASIYQTTWDGRNDRGQPLASGVFFYRLESPGWSEMKKMILLK